MITADNVSMDEKAKKISELTYQKGEISKLLNKKVKKGDKWYLIDNKWFKQWKRYVGFDSWDMENIGDKSLHPGPIDNTSILKPNSIEDELKEHLIEDLDYCLLPQEAWDCFLSWYDMADDQKPLERKVVEFGLFVKHAKVEIYLIELKLCLFPQLEKAFPRRFSKLDTVTLIEKEAKQIFEIPDSTETRMWNKYSASAIERLDNKETTVQDSGFSQGQLIILESKNEDGTWPIKSKKSLKSQTSTSDMKVDTNGPGLCGLSNLGNTCFMNAALQCMSNTPPLTQYFTDDRYWEELNTSNPLGMRGEMAKSYADLIKVIWSGRYSYTVPRNFKTIVGKFAPQFSGYQQQDCQELMAFLLDGLHEDLNKVKKKPYIEIKNAEGRPDSEVASESWENYLKRNNSIIVETFHGLLKSTLVCPDCAKVSVTFDPFCYLSLPLPVKKERSIEAIFIPLESNSKPLQIKVIVPKSGYISDLCQGVARLLDLPSERLIVIDVYNSRFHKLFRNEESLADIFDRDDIFVYEIPVENREEPSLIVPVYLREKEYYLSRGTNIPRLFGHPFLIQIPEKETTYQFLYDTIIEKMQRYVDVPTSSDQWWKHRSSDSEDLDISSDENIENVTQDVGKLKIHKIFEISSVNTFGNVTMETLEESDKPFSIGYRTYLAADWTPLARNKFYNEEKAREFEVHESMKQNVPQRKSSVQLGECIDLFTSVERLGVDDLWYCSTCKKHQQATKKFDLWKLPKVLIIHLKRFSYSRYWRDKLDLLVDFPVSGLNMKNYTINPDVEQPLYDLISVANHYGGMGGGHYTAYGKNRTTGGWFYFDDNSVSAVTERHPISKAAYVLFYQRRESDTNNMATTKKASSIRGESAGTS